MRLNLYYSWDTTKVRSSPAPTTTSVFVDNVPLEFENYTSEQSDPDNVLLGDFLSFSINDNNNEVRLIENPTVESNDDEDDDGQLEHIAIELIWEPQYVASLYIKCSQSPVNADRIPSFVIPHCIKSFTSHLSAHQIPVASGKCPITGRRRFDFQLADIARLEDPTAFLNDFCSTVRSYATAVLGWCIELVSCRFCHAFEPSIATIEIPPALSLIPTP